MSRWGNFITSWFILTLSLSCHGQDKYKPVELKLHQMIHLATLSNVNNLRRAVQAIAIKRVVDTPGHTKVRDYIRDFLEKLGWQVKLDIFTKKVPRLGYLTFMNILARHNPRAKRFLMLGCHYDSKYFQDFEYMGATDSAVPCAILLNLAEALKDQLEKSDLSLMFVFFDGAEAFGTWSKKDSLHGSRHLAKRWYRNRKIERIELFLLLDMIGTPDTTFKLYIDTTSSYYKRLVELEMRIISTGILRRKKYIFQIENGGDLEDDHSPFLKQDVPVVHLITRNYGTLWHKPQDVENRIDYTIVEQVDLVLRMFVAEYLRSKS